MKTIKDLKKIIKDLPDDMLIGGTGHFGELLETYDINIREDNNTKSLRFEIESAGEEPD